MAANLDGDVSGQFLLLLMSHLLAKDAKRLADMRNGIVSNLVQEGNAA